MAESQGDGRSIDNPTAPSDELGEAARSDADEQPVEGAGAGRAASSEGESVSEPGEGLVTEEGVNEPGTRAGSDDS